MKMAGALALAVVVIGVGTTMVVSQTVGRGSGDARRIVQDTVDAYAALTNYRDSGTATALGAGRVTQTTFAIRLQRPDLYRIEWNQTGGLYNGGGKTWNDGTGNYFQMDTAVGAGKPQKVQSMQIALVWATGVSSSTASMIPSIFFNEAWGNTLRGSLSDKSKLTHGKDEHIGGTDCYVVSSELDISKLPKPSGGFGGKMASQLSKTKTTFWIGKQDHLVRQTRTVVTSSGDFKLTDDDMAQVLRAQKKPVTPEAIAELRAKMDASTKTRRSMPKSGEFVTTQTHENIQVNQKFTEADFR